MISQLNLQEYAGYGGILSGIGVSPESDRPLWVYHRWCYLSAAFSLSRLFRSTHGPHSRHVKS